MNYGICAHNITAVCLNSIDVSNTARYDLTGCYFMESLVSYDPKMHDHAMNPVGQVQACMPRQVGPEAWPNIHGIHEWPWTRTYPGVPLGPTDVQATTSTTALDRQVGGDHYKKLPMQPWEIIDALDLDFYDGNALKYLLRWRSKGGVEDLRKAIHYIEHQIEKQEKA